MKKTEAKNTLITIMEAVEEAGGGCYDCAYCPFHNITIGSDCPFDECAVMWELRGEEK